MGGKEVFVSSTGQVVGDTITMDTWTLDMQEMMKTKEITFKGCYDSDKPFDTDKDWYSAMQVKPLGDYTAQWCAMTCAKLHHSLYGLTHLGGYTACVCGESLTASKTDSSKCPAGIEGANEGFTALYELHSTIYRCRELPKITGVVPTGPLNIDSLKTAHGYDGTCCDPGSASCGTYGTEVYIDYQTTLTKDGSIAHGDEHSVSADFGFEVDGLSIGLQQSQTFKLDKTVSWGKTSTQTMSVKNAPQCLFNTQGWKTQAYFALSCESKMYTVPVNFQMEACGMNFTVPGSVAQNTLETKCTCLKKMCSCGNDGCVDDRWGVNCGYSRKDGGKSVPVRQETCNKCPEPDFDPTKCVAHPEQCCKGDCAYKNEECVLNSCSGKVCGPLPGPCYQLADNCEKGITCPLPTRKQDGEPCRTVGTNPTAGLCYLVDHHPKCIPDALLEQAEKHRSIRTKFEKAKENVHSIDHAFFNASAAKNNSLILFLAVIGICMTLFYGVHYTRKFFEEEYTPIMEEKA